MKSEISKLLLGNGFLDEDVDFEKDLAALVIEESPEANFCCNECSKVCKTQRGLTTHKIQNTAPVEVVVVFQLAAKELFKRNYIQMCWLELSMSVQKSVSMTRVYLRRVEIFFEKNFLFTSEDSLQLLQKLKYIVEDFSGDAEKF